MPCKILKAFTKAPSPGRQCKYKILLDFVATLDLMSVPLFEGSMSAIVSSMEPSYLMSKIGLLEEYLRLLEESEMINAFNFFATISSAREDGVHFLTDGLISKICQQMVLAESQNRQDVMSTAMMLLSNISSPNFKCVMSSLKRHLDQPYRSILLTLDDIISRNNQESLPHLLYILSKLKSMTEVNLDSRINRIIYNLIKNFNGIIEKHLNYWEDGKRECAVSITDECERLAHDLCMKIVVALTRASNQSPMSKHDLETKALKTIKGHDLIRRGQKSTEAFNSFDLHPPTCSPSSGSIHCDTDKKLSFDIKEQRKAMSLFIQNIFLNNEGRNDLISCLLPVLRSPIREANITSTMFFSELLRHPGLIAGNVMEELINTIIGKIRNSDLVECTVAVEAIGNATRGAPKEVTAVRNSICEALLTKLADHRESTVIIEILKTLCKIARLLRQHKLGENFDRITELCICLLHHNKPMIQMHAASLFADLAQSYDTKIFGSFETSVENSLSTLFIKLHSKKSPVAAAGVVGLFHSLPYIGCTDIKILLGGNCTGEAKEKLLSLYEALGRKQPRLLKMMMLESTRFLRTNKEKNAVLKHLEMLRETIPHENLSPEDLKVISMDLWKILGHQKPLIAETANSAVELLGAKWKSLATILDLDWITGGEPATRPEDPLNDAKEVTSKPKRK